MWWLYFRRDGELVGVAIIEAPTLYHARILHETPKAARQTNR
jgi:hypothetical protein